MNTLSFRICLRAGLAAMLVLSIGLSLSGCNKGKGNKTGKFSGKVMFDGHVLKGGTVILQSTNPDHPQKQTITIHPSGNFELAGITPGEYYVGVETESIKSFAGGNPYGNKMDPKMMPKGVEMKQMDTSQMPQYEKIPAKYADPKSSGLKKITVVPNQKDPVTITLSKE